MKHKLLVLILTLTFVFSLTACGTEDLTVYKSEMDSFIKEITKVDTEMNKIDPDSDTAVKEMLECLDAMDKSFHRLADIDVPAQFGSVESLADEAAENMDLALENYNIAFSTPTYDEAYGNAANEYLQRALKRKEYISIILQGGTPEGDDVTITYEESETNE